MFNPLGESLAASTHFVKTSFGTGFCRYFLMVLRFFILSYIDVFKFFHLVLEWTVTSGALLSGLRFAYEGFRGCRRLLSGFVCLVVF